MNLSAPFIRRPVATLLLSIAIMLLGSVSFGLLPVSPLPEMDFPVITVDASYPGASPEVMAATVATPLERSLGTISGIQSMNSTSSQGSTRIMIEFDLSRDINGAARDVQGAINAAREMLPSGMPNNPTYRKINPSQAPIMLLAMTSDVLDSGQLYDVSSTIIAQKISQIGGVGEVQVGGSSLPAVRVELEPYALSHYGIALDDVRRIINNANVRRPKGAVENAQHRWQVMDNDQLEKAAGYAPLIVRADGERVLRLSDVATVYDAVEDRYNSGYYNNQQAILLVINRQSGANIIKTVQAIHEALPNLRALLPDHVQLNVAMDRSPGIGATLHEAELTLIIAVILVALVVLLFLGNLRAALIPALAVPVSLVGTFAVMYLMGFSLNNLSLMALIVVTGLVVDDAIVVLENIARHMHNGMPPGRAALVGTQEVGFTLVSMNLSLAMIFVALLFMGGILQRLFMEFVVTLVAAVLISLLVSLTLTPMLCARWLKEEKNQQPNCWQAAFNRFFAALVERYRLTLSWALRHSRLTLLLLFATIGLNVFLYVAVPKAFLPQQDTGLLWGFVRGDDAMSFQVMQPKVEQYRRLVMNDPAVESVAGFIGGGSGVNNAIMLVRLKPKAERDDAQAVTSRLQKKAQNIPGARMFLMPAQDIQIGGRQGRGSENEYQLKGDDLQQLSKWTISVAEAMRKLPQITNIDADENEGAQQIMLQVDREQARRLGVDMSLVMNLLNNAYSQRQVATIYQSLNQYRVVMEVNPRYAQYPDVLDQVRVIAADGRQVPLSSFSHYRYGLESDRVRHEGQFAASYISFDLAEGITLDAATQAIDRAVAEIGLPKEIQGTMGGTGGVLQSTMSGQPLMILCALVLVYIVLGVLYESYIHPLTILSTLPSAGVGALLALLLLKTEFSVISLLGLFLLIGIVMKNAILMIDLALQLECNDGMDTRSAIENACILRFRPILMTTLAALLGALPLMLGSAEGAEMRSPLGITIVGGLILSQLLTLYTTPVVYLYLDRLSTWSRGLFRRRATATTDS